MPEIQLDEPTLRSLWVVLSFMALMALAWLFMASHDATVRRHRRAVRSGGKGRPRLRDTLAEAARRISWLWSRDLPMPWAGRRPRRRSSAPRSRSAPATPAGSAATATRAPLSTDEVRAQENRTRVQHEFEQMRQAQRAQFDKARQARASGVTAAPAPGVTASAFADTAPMPGHLDPAAPAHASSFVRLDLEDAQAQTLVHAFAPTAPMDETASHRPPPEAAPDAASLARAGFQSLS